MRRGPRSVRWRAPRLTHPAFVVGAAPAAGNAGGRDARHDRRGETADSPFPTRETVLMDTLARAATSRIVGREWSPDPVVNVGFQAGGSMQRAARYKFSSCSLNGSVIEQTTLSFDNVVTCRLSLRNPGEIERGDAALAIGIFRPRTGISPSPALETWSRASARH